MSPYGHQLRANGPINYFERYIMTQIYSFISNRSFKSLVLAVVAMCSACSSDPIPDTEEGKTPIGFGVTESRAPISAASDIQAFSVWARFSNTQTPEMTLMNGEVVYRDPVDFTYDNTKYWINGTYHFYAIHPSALTGAYDDENLVLNNNTQSITIPNFNSASQTDLCVTSARVSRTYPEGGTGDVTFNLRHTLTQVKVSLFKSDGNSSDAIVIKSVQLSGMKETGTYTVTGNTGAWSNLQDTYTWYQSLNQNNVLNLSSGTAVMATALLIPQTIDEKTLVLTVNFTVNGKADMKTLNLPAITWTENSIVNYKCSLSVKHDIVLGTVTVTPWGEMEAGGTVVIK